MPDDHREGFRPVASFARRALVATGVAAAVLVLLLIVYFFRSVVLLVFSGGLAAIGLSGLARVVSRSTRLPHAWALGVVLVVLVALAGGIGWLLAPRVAGQIDQLSETLPRSLHSLHEYLKDYAWGRRLVDRLPNAGEVFSAIPSVLPRALGVFSSTLGVLANLVIVLFIGIYGAAEPAVYTDGLVRLVTPSRRDRARDVLAQIGHTMRWWLVARLASMAVIGVLTTVGLALLGVPLALTLGLIAGLLSFIPYLGPVLSAVPAILLALVDSPMLALYVMLLFIGIQTIESYLVTPLIERKAVHLPPALTISVQVLLALLAGFFGVLLASPLTALAIVLIRTLYVEDVLHDRVG